MTPLDKNDIRRLTNEIDALYTAIRCGAYYRALSGRHTAEDRAEEPWGTIEFTLLLSLLVNWNEIFGIEKKDSHWREITLESSEFIHRLYDVTGLDYRSWTDYRRYVNELCHDFVRFPDPYHHAGQDYDLEALQASLTLSHQWLNELVTASEELADGADIDKWPIREEGFLENLHDPMNRVVGK